MSILKKTMIHRFPNRQKEINALMTIFNFEGISNTKAVLFYEKVILKRGDGFWKELCRLLGNDRLNPPSEKYVMGLFRQSLQASWWSKPNGPALWEIMPAATRRHSA